MAVQYIREYIDVNQLYELEARQVSQIQINGVFGAEIFKHGQRIIIDDVAHNDVFFLHSPDLPNMSIRDVLTSLTNDNYYIEDVWSLTNEPLNNILDTPVHLAPVSQIGIRTFNQNNN
jgi:hypothetical protein